MGKLPRLVELSSVASAELSLIDSARQLRNLATQPLPQSLPPAKSTKHIIEFDGKLKNLTERPDNTVIKINRPHLKDAIKQLHQKTEAGCIIALNLPTGTGKSHDFGSLDANEIESDIFYLHNQWRNPTVTTIEHNYEPVGGKHGGLVRDYNRLTEDGYPYVRHRRDNEELEEFDIKANCKHFETFKIVREKGIRLLGGKGSANCENCDHYKNNDGKLSCSALWERFKFSDKEENNFGQYRTHLVNLPNLSSREEPSLAIIDESDRELQSLLKTFTVQPFDTWTALAKLDEKHPKLASILKPIAECLRIIMSDFKNHHGANLSELQSLIDIKELLKELIGANAISPNIDITDITPRALKTIAKAVDKLLEPDLMDLFTNCSNPEERAERARNFIAPNWISPLLRAFAGSGSVRIDSKGLHFTKVANHLVKNLKSANTVIVASATNDLTGLAYQLKYPKKRIITVELAEPPQYSNLKIRIVSGMKIKGDRRDDSDNCATNRLNQLIDKITSDPNKTYAVIDSKKNLSNYEDKRGIDYGYWHSQDTRGGNRFKTKKVIVLVGAPFPNIGEAICEYETLTGRSVNLKYSSDRLFMAWLNRKKDAEVSQAIGRLRANNRQSESLECWLIDCQYSQANLESNFPGAVIEKVNLFEFCPEALQESARKEFEVIRHMAQYADEKITRDGMAHQLSMSTGNISKIAMRLCQRLGIGAKQAFKTLSGFVTRALSALLSGSDGTSNPDHNWFLEDYFPHLLREVSQRVTEPIEIFEAIELAYSQFGPTADEIFGKLSIEQGLQLIDCIFQEFGVERPPPSDRQTRVT